MMLGQFRAESHGSLSEESLSLAMNRPEQKKIGRI
jgi:hypothetical protein